MVPEMCTFFSAQNTPGQCSHQITEKIHPPALGYVAMTMSSGLALKFWILSQFSVKYLVM